MRHGNLSTIYKVIVKKPLAYLFFVDTVYVKSTECICIDNRPSHSLEMYGFITCFWALITTGNVHRGNDGAINIARIYLRRLLSFDGDPAGAVQQVLGR